MSRHTCIVCREPIPNGQAHIRSRVFVQVALCESCALPAACGRMLCTFDAAGGRHLQRCTRPAGHTTPHYAAA